MIRRIREIILKELIQTLREPRMRSMLFLPPLIQLLVFGYAVNLDVQNARIAWVDGDSSPSSRQLLSGFTGSHRFQISSVSTGEKQIEELMDRGKIDAAVLILPGFERHILRGEPTSVQVLVDGTNSNTASLVANYAIQVIGAFSKRVAASNRTAAIRYVSAARLNARTRVWFNPELKSRNFFVPGVVVNIIMMVTLMLTTLAIVREKEIGTMEQLMVTPIRPVELIIGKTAPFALVGLFDLVLVTSAALLIFRIPFRGSALLLLLCSILFLLTSLGAGLYLSTISKTQQQAMMGSFFFSLPAFMLSGFTFPIRNMPAVVQYVTYLNPVRYFMEIVRGIFLKGVGLSELWPQTLALALIGVAVLGSSALRFHKRLD